MVAPEFYEYRIVLSRDAETGHIVAEVPALDLADFGETWEEALRSIQEMVTFHLECLLEEGKGIPKDTAGEEGLYLRVSLPTHAA